MKIKLLIYKYPMMKVFLISTLNLLFYIPFLETIPLYQGIEPGDLVVHGMDGFAGSIGISDSRGKATPVLNVLDSTQIASFYFPFLSNNISSFSFKIRSCSSIFIAISSAGSRILCSYRK